MIAPEVGGKRRAEHMDRLDRLAVSVNLGVKIESIRMQGVAIARPGAQARLVAADHVIIAGAVEKDTTLFDALQGRVPERYAVGDCTGLGLIRKATEDGARAACAI